MMEQIKMIFGFLTMFINVLGLTILSFGILKMAIKYIRLEIKSPWITPLKGIQEIRREIAVYLLLGLDFLIAGDILSSIQDLSTKEITMLATMIVIRIAMGYFLGKELVEINDEKRKNESSV